MISYYHIGYSRLDYGFTPGQENYMPNFSRIVMNLCAMGVPLFFIAAGYLTISRKYTARKIFLKILTIAVLATLWNYITPFPVWFLITLSGLYLIQPIIHFLQEKHPTLYIVMMLGAAMPSFVYNFAFEMGLLLDSSIVEGFRRGGALTTYAIVYYMVGGLLVKYRIKVKTALLLLLLGIALTTMEGIIITNHTGKMFDNVNASFPTLGALSMSLGLYSLLLRISINENRVSRSLEIIGGTCLAVYIFHLTAAHLILGDLYRSIWGCRIQMNIFSCLIYTLIVDIVCALAGYSLQSIPYIRNLLKL